MKPKILLLILLLSVSLAGCGSSGGKKDFGVTLLELTVEDYASRDLSYFEDLFETEGIEYSSDEYDNSYKNYSIKASDIPFFGNNMSFRLENTGYTDGNMPVVRLFYKIYFESEEESEKLVSALKKYCSSKQLKGFFGGESEEDLEEGWSESYYVISKEEVPDSWLGEEIDIEDGLYYYKEVFIEEDLTEGRRTFPDGSELVYNTFLSVTVDFYVRSELNLKDKAFRNGAVDSYEAELCPAEYDAFTSESNFEWTLNGKKCDDLASAVKPGAKVRIKVKREGDEIIYKVTTK